MPWLNAVKISRDTRPFFPLRLRGAISRARPQLGPPIRRSGTSTRGSTCIVGLVASHYRESNARERARTFARTIRAFSLHRPLHPPERGDISGRSARPRDIIGPRGEGCKDRAAVRSSKFSGANWKSRSSAFVPRRCPYLRSQGRIVIECPIGRFPRVNRRSAVSLLFLIITGQPIYIGANDSRASFPRRESPRRHVIPCFAA